MARKAGRRARGSRRVEEDIGDDIEEDIGEDIGVDIGEDAKVRGIGT
jgi:uncharacterized protein YuzE